MKRIPLIVLAVVFSLWVGAHHTRAQTITFTNPNPAAGDEFGYAVAAVGNDNVLIGAPFDDTGATNAGVAYLFDLNGTLLRTVPNPTPAFPDGFGNSVAGVGIDKVLIGTRNADAAYLFDLNGNLLRTFNNPTPEVGDSFGESVAAVGTDKVLIGANGDNTGEENAGAAYLFDLNGNLLRTFTNPTPALNDRFGFSVAAVGTDKVLIGIYAGGAAYLFDLNGNLLRTFTNPSPGFFDLFGRSVAGVGTDKVLIGAVRDFADAGAAYLFNTNGTLLRTFKNPTPVSLDEFGGSVAVVGTDKVLIGAVYDSTGASFAGTAYLFNFSGALLNTLTNPTPASSDFFGAAVAAVGGDKLLIGAPNDNTGANDAGAAYVIFLQLPLYITRQPAGTNVLEGQTLSLTVAANGAAPLSYRWRKNGMALTDGGRVSGAMTTNLIVIDARLSDAGAYTVVVSNSFVVLTSQVATVTVGLAPQIVQQPQSSTNLQGTTATFTVAAIGTAPLTYQWRRDGVNLFNSGHVSGATSTNLVISNVQLSDNGTYTVLVSNIVGTAVSTPVTLTVLAAPAITSQPQSRTNLQASTVTFTVATTGTTPLSYRWQKDDLPLLDGGRIFGVGGTMLTVAAVQLSDAGAYTAVVSNSVGVVTSQVATLTVTTPAAGQTVMFANPHPGGLFGQSVAAVGTNKVLFGSFNDIGAENAGAAYLFDLQGTLLTTFTNPTPNPEFIENFSRALTSVGTDKVVIGAEGDNTGAAFAGAAYLFALDGTLLTTFTNPTPAVLELFGSSVAAVGADKVVIGAPGAQSIGTKVGAAYLFDLNGTLLTSFNNPTPASGENFGDAVAAVGADKVLIGAAEDGTGALGAGAAYLFDLNGTLLKTFTNPAPASADFKGFGYSVAGVGSDRVLIGACGTQPAPPFRSLAGAAYIFSTNGTLLMTFTNPIPSPDACFGNAVVAVGMDKVLIGAREADTGGTDAGMAYLFTLPGPPSLRFTRASGMVTLLWDRPATGFVLDETPHLNPPIPWMQVPFPYQTNATHISISVPLPASNAFYRLRQ